MMIAPFLVREPETTKLRELSRVAATHEIRDGERLVPRGAVGTVVLVYGDGAAYEVEFTSPSHLVVLAHPDDLRPR